MYTHMSPKRIWSFPVTSNVITKYNKSQRTMYIAYACASHDLCYKYKWHLTLVLKWKKWPNVLSLYHMPLDPNASEFKVSGSSFDFFLAQIIMTYNRPTISLLNIHTFACVISKRSTDRCYMKFLFGADMLPVFSKHLSRTSILSSGSFM